MIKNIKNNIRNYFLITSGAVAIVFGVTLPVIVATVGVTVDVAQASLVRDRLCQSLDAAALAAASMEGVDASTISTRLENFMMANYPDGKIGQSLDVEVIPNETDDEDILHVRATGQVETSIVRVLGEEYETIDITCETKVKQEVKGLEVVLVLDNTGSMATNNNIGALRTNATNFVNIMFEAVAEADDVRIGLVPYSTSVNVGPYGIGKDLNGVVLPDGGFVEPPATDIYKSYKNSNFSNYTSYGIAETDLTYDPSKRGQWHGCVVEGDYPLDVTDHVGPWKMYRYDYEGSTNSYYQQNWKKIGGVQYTQGDRKNAEVGPNYICPDQPIVPLTSNQGALLTAINGMQADGWTLGNIGMVWGLRVISPEFPFTEGADWDSNRWQKVIIMMTDGDNTMSSEYSAYGKTNSHSVRPTQENERFAEVCETMKENGITIYTITFTSGIGPETKQYYEECATDISKYFDAPDQEDLAEVFEKIARELSNLHLTE